MKNEELRKLKEILDLIDKYPEDFVQLWRALMCVVSPQQRQIVELINRTGWMDVKAIADTLNSTHQTVSSQLSILKKVGLLRNVRSGRQSLFAIAKKYSPNFL